jgi:PAS domain S-box-containing protein
MGTPTGIAQANVDMVIDLASRLEATTKELRAAREELATLGSTLRDTQARLAKVIADHERAVAEHEETEQRLRNAEESSRKLFDENVDSMLVLDLLSKKYVDANQQFVRSSGYLIQDVIGKGPRDFQFFDDPEDYRRFNAELKAKGSVRNMETTFRRKDGSTYADLVSAVILSLAGRYCLVLITRDISALKEAERQLVEAREAALSASRAKSEFLSSMSHEIRTPMNAVLGMADLLWESPLDDEQRRYLEIMRTNGNTLLDLINDVLDLAKVESGRLTLENVDFDIRDLADKVADTVGMRAHEKQVELVARVAPEVPANLVGDPLRLRQVLINLLGNAVKFTEKGEIVLTIETTEPTNRSDEGDERTVLRFSVADTGIGIPADRLDAIFSAFTQGDSSTTRKFGGTGLGLTIVKRLVELYHGQISVQSEVGKGSTFSFTAEFGVRPAPEQPASARPADLVGVRTLVVDDTAVNRLVLRETLSARGAFVTCVEAGRAALDEINRASLRGTPYRIVLLDCRMPEMDGIEVAARIRQIGLPPSEQPIILMLTSDDLAVTLARAREVGIDLYLVKPIKRAELLDAIGRALGRAAGVAPTAGESAALSSLGMIDDMRPLKLLLADDSPDNRLLIRAYLKQTPYLLDDAVDGAVAVEKWKTGAYDLILMDIQMPVMDGYTATLNIRGLEAQDGRSRTPIVALTASSLEESVRKALEVGCDAHVAKPVKKITLLNAIRKAVKQAD